MVFEETTGVYMYLSFQFQMNKNEIGMCEFEMHLKNGHLNCKGPQTNMPQNVDRIFKRPDQQNIHCMSRDTEFCKADRTTLCFGFLRPVFFDVSQS